MDDAYDGRGWVWSGCGPVNSIVSLGGLSHSHVVLVRHIYLIVFYYISCSTANTLTFDKIGHQSN